MEEKEFNIDEEIKEFHFPRWNEFPNVDLYLDQVVTLIEQYLGKFLSSSEDEKVVTKTMINNYVKHKVVNAPVNKKYGKEHLAYLFVVFILKQIYSMDEIKLLIHLAIKTSSVEKAYDRFGDELEKAIISTFEGKSYIKEEKMSQEQYLLKNAVQSFANKLYVQRIYLKNK